MKTPLIMLAVVVFGAQAQEQPRSRAAVVAELDAARAAGELGAWNGEDGGSFLLSSRPSDAGVPTLADALSRFSTTRARGDRNPMLGEDSGSFELSRAGYAEPRTLVANTTGDEGE